MLSRTADNLLWLSRYLERAENTARLLDVTFRTALLPSIADPVSVLWRPALMVGHDIADFARRYGEPSATAVVEFMAFDAANPSSIQTCIAKARENARAERSAISAEMWESLNDTFLALGAARKRTEESKDDGPRSFFDWVKERSHLFRGVSFGTMYRAEAFHFLRLGTFFERADNTARIFDVRYPLLVPEGRGNGQVDYYQWGALLRAVSAFRAYRLAYKDTIRPERVAELLILDANMPRSLHHCVEALESTLEQLSRTRRMECARLCGELHAALKFGRIDRVATMGVNRFLADFLARLDVLGRQIQRDFLMTGLAA